MSNTPSVTRVQLAEARSQAARARLSDTVGLLQDRARPSTLAHDVTQKLRVRGSEVATELAGKARDERVQAGAVLLAAGMFFARHRIADMFRRATGSKSRYPYMKRGPNR